MFTKFKNLFRKDIDEVLATSIPAPQNRTATGSMSPRPTAPVSVVAAPPAPRPKQHVNETGKSPEVISLSLKSVLARLPSSLSPAVQTQGTGFVTVPTSHILQELPKGAVKISFGELRRRAPAGAFLDSPRHDQVLVELPLNEILARLPTSLLSRRPEQKQVEIPDEVTNVFGPRGQGANAGLTHPKPAEAPARSAHNRAEETLIHMPEAPPTAVAVEPPIHVLPAAPEPSVPGEVLEVGLLALSQNWPEAVRQEIRTSVLGAATVFFPVEKLEPGLRSGKIVFTWKEICEAILPRPAVAVANPDMPLELPLQVIAPLFVAKRRQPKGRKAISISDLPDLFSKTVVPIQKTSEAPVATPVVLPPPPPAEPVPAPAPKAQTAAAVEKPAVPFAGTPAQIVKHLVAQPGITGAFIAMHDGLLVEAQLHASLKADTVAAFLPQIFGRMNQYTKELQLGSLTSLVLNVENSSWQIVKSGGMFLVAIGDPKNPFPLEKLNALAVQLSVKIQ